LKHRGEPGGGDLGPFQSFPPPAVNTTALPGSLVIGYTGEPGKFHSKPASH
jgi:hypothetical protein